MRTPEEKAPDRGHLVAFINQSPGFHSGNKSISKSSARSSYGVSVASVPKIPEISVSSFRRSYAFLVTGLIVIAVFSKFVSKDSLSEL